MKEDKILKQLLEVFNRTDYIAFSLFEVLYVGSNKKENREHYEGKDKDDAYNEIHGWFAPDGTFIENKHIRTILEWNGDIVLSGYPEDLAWNDLTFQDKQDLLRVVEETINRLEHPEMYELPF